VDKKNTLIGTLLMVAAIVTLFYSQKNSRQPPSPREVRREVAEQSAAAPTPAAVAIAENTQAFTTAQADHSGAQVSTLENAYIQVRFTDYGGAVRDIALKKYPASLGDPSPFIFNELHADPILGFVGIPGLDRSTRFERLGGDPSQVAYRAVLDGRIEVTRRYSIAPDSSDTNDPYRIRAETTFRNLSDHPTPSVRFALSVGTAAPTNALDNGQELTTGLSTGTNQTFILRSSLQGGSFLGFGAREPKPLIASEGPIVWATVKDRFFASILTPDEPGVQLVTRRVKLFSALRDEDPLAYGVTATAEFELKSLAPHASEVLGSVLYVGPKEYHRLSNADVFKHDEDRIMEYGWLRLPAAILLTLMTWTHGWTANWGVAILLTTLSLKFAFLPLTLSASRSAKRMQKIQPELKEIREKFKDNPQKQQSATMELFKRAKVNPMGGCIPILITIPFFFGFYRMLRSAAELRFAPFLWAKDLTAPDTILSVGHGTLPFIGTLDINILPVLLCATVFMQMRITPQPMVDNAQARMMKFMPFLFMIFCYSYSCALSLYSTVNGLFTIGQQVIINRMKDVDVAADAGSAKSGSGKGFPGKAIKNVTPKKRV